MGDPTPAPPGLGRASRVGRWVADTARWTRGVAGYAAVCAVAHLLLVFGFAAVDRAVAGRGIEVGDLDELLMATLVYGAPFGALVGVAVGVLTGPAMAVPGLAARPGVRAAVVWAPPVLWVAVTVGLAWPVRSAGPAQLAAVTAMWHVGPAVWMHLALRRLVSRWRPGPSDRATRRGPSGRVWEYGR